MSVWELQFAEDDPDLMDGDPYLVAIAKPLNPQSYLIGYRDCLYQGAGGCSGWIERPDMTAIGVKRVFDNGMGELIGEETRWEIGISKDAIQVRLDESIKRNASSTSYRFVRYEVLPEWVV